MADSVAELFSRLRFRSRPVETLYLNETRVHDNFYGQVGAIESFSRAATKDGALEAPVVKISASVSSEASVTWTLSDPIAQVLVLRSALESQNLVRGENNAKPGDYIAHSGAGLVSRPEMFDDLHRDSLEDHAGLYEALEAERAKQEDIARVIEDPDKKLWLLTVREGNSVCAAILDNVWLRPVFGHWINPGYAAAPWEIFGLCRRIHDSGVPMVATLYVGVRW